MSDNISRQSIEFIKPFDGTQPEIPLSEQKQAADEFRTLAEDTMLANMGGVRVFTALRRSASLGLEVEAEDKSKLRVYIESNNPEDAEYLKPYEISLQEISPDGYGRKFVRYELARDGSCVTRKDITEDARADSQAEKQHEPNIDRESMSPSEMIDDIDKRIAETKVAIEKSAFQTSMGVYDQPVGVDEIRTLAELVTKAVPKR